MAKSRIRRKARTGSQPPPPSKGGPSPQWVPGLMVGLFLFGLGWIVVYYISDSQLPIDALGNYNLIVGFAFITGGFITATQWH